MADDLTGKVAAVVRAALVNRARPARRAGGRDGRAMPLVADLLDPARVEAMMPATVKRCARLGILGAKAGAHVGGPVLEADPDARNRTLDLDVDATFRAIALCCRTWPGGARARWP